MVMEFFMPLPHLKTRRLRLRAARASDLEQLWMLWNVPEVRHYLFDDQPVPREHAAALLECARALAWRGLGLWMVERALGRTEVHTVIGCVALTPAKVVADYDPGVKGLVEPLVAFTPPMWGRGYAHEALRAVIDYAFRTLRLPVLAAAADVPNEPSHRMLRGLGFAPARECQGPSHRLRTYRLSAAAFNDIAAAVH